MSAGPRRAPSAARARLLAGEPPESIATHWPVFGEEVRAGGRRMREVTFVADVPAGSEALLHVNGITDAHRDDIAPSLFEPVPGAPIAVIAVLLPDDLIASYRFAVAPSLERHAGRTREGWLRIHAAGRPDARNHRRLPNPLGAMSSVLVMPGARLHPAWGGADDADDADGPARHGVREHRVERDGDLPMTVLTTTNPDGRTLILFDGERWAAVGIERALARHAAPPSRVVFVPSGDGERRSALLPHPERIAAHLEEQVLPLLGHPVDPADLIVAGQSYGGLAAAAVVALRPDLARTAIVQSGSFHFRAETEVRPPTGQVGDLLDRIVGAALTGRFLVQAGTEESGMLDSALLFAERARDAGADVSVRAYSGGHDYAWWRSGLFDGLDQLHC